MIVSDSIYSLSARADLMGFKNYRKTLGSSGKYLADLRLGLIAIDFSNLPSIFAVLIVNNSQYPEDNCGYSNIL